MRLFRMRFFECGFSNLLRSCTTGSPSPESAAGYLPICYNIAEAYRFVDYLKSAGQTCCQVLPLGPTGYGDSPYQSFSAFAGNPYFISPDALVLDGLLTQAEAEEALYEGPKDSVPYAWLYKTRRVLLRKAFERWKNRRDNLYGKKADPTYEEYLRENEACLPDYALFMALKTAHGGVSFRPGAFRSSRRRLWRNRSGS